MIMGACVTDAPPPDNSKAIGAVEQVLAASAALRRELERSEASGRRMLQELQAGRTFAEALELADAPFLRSARAGGRSARPLPGRACRRVRMAMIEDCLRAGLSRGRIARMLGVTGSGSRSWPRTSTSRTRPSRTSRCCVAATSPYHSPMSDPVPSEGAVVVVGASLAGLRAAEEVRHEGHAGPVIIVGDEIHAPYDRPPLSKQLLSGKWDVERIHHHTPDILDALGHRIPSRPPGHRPRHRGPHGAPRRRHRASTTTVSSWPPAPPPGACPAPRAWPASGCCAPSTTASASGPDLEAAGRAPAVVVIGAGFIGSEVAATCQGMGADVTVVEALPHARSPGCSATRWAGCAPTCHLAKGMDLRCGVGVDRLESDPGGAGSVVGAPGRRHAPARPTWWWWASACARRSGGSRVGARRSTTGCVCDGSLFAGDRVVAAGDVARLVPPTTGRPARVEHWTNAAEGGAAAARNLLAGSAAAVPYDPVPFFWSDQYATKIQMIGLPGAGRRGGGGGAVGRGGQAGGPVPSGRPAERRAGHSASRAKLMGYRPLLAAGASFDEALAHAGSDVSLSGTSAVRPDPVPRARLRRRGTARNARVTASAAAICVGRRLDRRRRSHRSTRSVPRQHPVGLVGRGRGQAPTVGAEGLVGAARAAERGPRPGRGRRRPGAPRSADGGTAAPAHPRHGDRRRPATMPRGIHGSRARARARAMGEHRSRAWGWPGARRRSGRSSASRSRGTRPGPRRGRPWPARRRGR